ncbi:unnamed protein product [Lota lota]
MDIAFFRDLVMLEKITGGSEWPSPGLSDVLVGGGVPVLKKTCSQRSRFVCTDTPCVCQPATQASDIAARDFNGDDVIV